MKELDRVLKQLQAIQQAGLMPELLQKEAIKPLQGVLSSFNSVESFEGERTLCRSFWQGTIKPQLQALEERIETPHVTTTCFLSALQHASMYYQEAQTITHHLSEEERAFLSTLQNKVKTHYWAAFEKGEILNNAYSIHKQLKPYGLLAIFLEETPLNLTIKDLLNHL